MKEFFSLPKNKKKEIEQKIIDLLKKDDSIRFAFLYGSFIDIDVSFRDIDIAIYTESYKAAGNESIDYILDESVELSREIGFPVDVQVVNNAPLGFKFSVLKNGRLLFTRDEIFLEDLIERVSLEYMSFFDIMMAESA